MNAAQIETAMELFKKCINDDDQLKIESVMRTGLLGYRLDEMVSYAGANARISMINIIVKESSSVPNLDYIIYKDAVLFNNPYIVSNIIDVTKDLEYDQLSELLSIAIMCKNKYVIDKLLERYGELNIEYIITAIKEHNAPRIEKLYSPEEKAMLLSRLENYLEYKLTKE